MGRLVQYWAYYKVNFHSLHHDIWAKLDEKVPPHYQKERNPHVTVHPRFQFPEENIEEFKHYVHEVFPRTISIKVNDFHYYPNEHKPMVICLDVAPNINFQRKQKQLSQLIDNNGGKNVLEPSSPHITLYNSRDRGGQFRKIPNNVNQIKTQCKKISERKLPIKISNSELVIKESPGMSTPQH